MSTPPAQPLWRPGPARVAAARITDYQAWLERHHGLRFDHYDALWRWSVESLEDFWESIWRYFGVIAHSPWQQVLAQRVMPGARWFDGATLNYAEHALARAADPAAAARPALVGLSETRARQDLSWSQLAAATAALAATLHRLGVRRGDRVAAYLPNIPEATIALLASASLGAVWSSCSPEMGAAGVLERLRQIAPRVLLAVDGYRYGGRDHDRRALVAELVAALPSVEQVILVPYLDTQATLDLGQAGRPVGLTSFAAALERPAPLRFEALPFDHPLWVVYSSGTTGLPKPIVHGHGGTILETFKGAGLHLDVGPQDRFLWHSSTSWIMWNLLVSTLLCGATVVQFDGNPGHPDPNTLWRLAADEQLSFLGTSPAFLAQCMRAQLTPGASHDLGALRTLGSTGSPLPAEAYQWVYQAVGTDLLLASISGGTDPAAAFVGACPTLPVYAGEMQCRGLGVAVAAFDSTGAPVLDAVGELVCTAPLPSLPLCFWGDTDGRRYRETYFETFPGAWHHGDWLRLIPRPESVTAVIYGRSDATINRHGIRMGSAEFYRVVEALPQVADSLVVDLEYLGRPSCLLLFVVLHPGAVLDDALHASLREALRRELSARHLPDRIVAVPEVPRTLSGKKMEVPVKRLLLGHPVERAVNRSAMANPAALEPFLALAAAAPGALP